MGSLFFYGTVGDSGSADSAQRGSGLSSSKVYNYIAWRPQYGSHSQS